MNRTAWAALSLLLVAPFAFGADPVDAKRAEPFMGAYVHVPMVLGKTKGEAAGRKAIAKCLDAFKASGLKTVMPSTTTTSGSAIFASKLVPDRSYPDWDPIAVFTEEAHKRGLQVWPWVCVLPCGDEQVKGIVKQHPEWGLRDAQGKTYGCISPFNLEAREWMASVLEEVVTKYQPEGILLDYLRFPSSKIQPDAASLVRLEKLNPEYASADKETKAKILQAWKERELTELAGAIGQRLRKAKPGLKIGMYSWGPQVSKNHHVAQMWPVWVEKGYIDMVNISGYCFKKNMGDEYLKVFEERMCEAVQTVKQAGSKAQVTFTLGVKTSHGEVEKAEEIEAYLDIAAKCGMQGTAVFTWSYIEKFMPEVEKAGYVRDFEQAAAKNMRAQ